MRFDLIGQSLLLTAVVLFYFFSTGRKWSGSMLVVLSLWQLASALHLFYAYRYVRKLNYQKTALILGISLPVWIYLVGILAWAPVLGLIIWYFYQTVRDALIVYRRPKSFWDLR